MVGIPRNVNARFFLYIAASFICDMKTVFITYATPIIFQFWTNEYINSNRPHNENNLKKHCVGTCSLESNHAHKIIV